MTIGRVTVSRDVLVRLTVRGPTGKERDIEAVLDTGFNGALALPSQLVDNLDLERLGSEQVTLASGEKRTVRTYEATTVWLGTPRTVFVIEAAESLLGMGLLWGYEVRIQCMDGGRVALGVLTSQE